MKDMVDSPGSSVVGRLTDIAPWEAELILSMRHWMDGQSGQAKVWNGFARCFGPVDGRTEMRQFETLMTSLCAHARRPLARHGLFCVCIGSDEAIFQTLVREAARGDLAEAALIASLLVPAAYAELIALKAAQVGQAMQIMTRDMPFTPRHQIRTSGRKLH